MIDPDRSHIRDAPALVDRLIVFAFTAKDVANLGEFPFGALIDSKISDADYKVVTDVEQIRRSLDGERDGATWASGPVRRKGDA